MRAMLRISRPASPDTTLYAPGRRMVKPMIEARMPFDGGRIRHGAIRGPSQCPRWFVDPLRMLQNDNSMLRSAHAGRRKRWVFVTVTVAVGVTLALGAMEHAVRS